MKQNGYDIKIYSGDRVCGLGTDHDSGPHYKRAITIKDTLNNGLSCGLLARTGAGDD